MKRSVRQSWFEWMMEAECKDKRAVHFKKRAIFLVFSQRKRRKKKLDALKLYKDVRWNHFRRNFLTLFPQISQEVTHANPWNDFKNKRNISCYPKRKRKFRHEAVIVFTFAYFLSVIAQCVHKKQRETNGPNLCGTHRWGRPCSAMWLFDLHIPSLNQRTTPFLLLIPPISFINKTRYTFVSEANSLWLNVIVLRIVWNNLKKRWTSKACN